jgi:hypothetical protein
MPAPTPERVVEAADAYARAMLYGTSPRAANLRNVFKAELMALVESRSAPPRMPSCLEGCRDGDHAEGCVYRVEYVQADGGHLVERPDEWNERIERAATAGVRMGGRSVATIPVHPLEHLHPGESAPGLAEPLVRRPDETEEEFGTRKAVWEARRLEERKNRQPAAFTPEERAERDDARRRAVFGSVSSDVPPPIPTADRRAASAARANFRTRTATGEVYRDGERIA